MNNDSDLYTYKADIFRPNTENDNDHVSGLVWVQSARGDDEIAHSEIQDWLNKQRGGHSIKNNLVLNLKVKKVPTA